LPQIYIILTAEEKMSSNALITSERCNILFFSKAPHSLKWVDTYIDTYKISGKGCAIIVGIN
jgi:hypothetical protein